MSDDFQLSDLSLGKETDYQTGYSSELLQAVPRSLNRQELGCTDSQPFHGEDVWHAYELSWLNGRGKPVVALGRFILDSVTPNIIESKSFKLYLNSLNQSRFSDQQQLRSLLENDLSVVAGGKVSVELFAPEDNLSFASQGLPGECIDGIDISIDEFRLSPELISLSPDSEAVSETLHSHLLKSNCLITKQPDWASVVIQYSGLKIDREGLLRYLISFRMHNEFHEQCVERIFCDILNACNPKQLSVQALYTRRGGLDINPFRTSLKNTAAPLRRVNRQ
ncbi:MAG: NADPH-dependent 7-cyano-7-deazaguanine reductase QueF [Arenicella sp.]|nr:NADPH-dependent 7-cyano-7-deazaguanine reductase QueF [Arenicella sp.]